MIECTLLVWHCRGSSGCVAVRSSLAVDKGFLLPVRIVITAWLSSPFSPRGTSSSLQQYMQYLSGRPVVTVVYPVSPSFMFWVCGAHWVQHSLPQMADLRRMFAFSRARAFRHARRQIQDTVVYVSFINNSAGIRTRQLPPTGMSESRAEPTSGGGHIVQ